MQKDLGTRSGLRVSTWPFSCPWDARQIGWIYQDKAALREAFQRKRLSEQLRQRIFRIFREEVAELDQYLAGDVWMITLRDAADQVKDAVSGVLGYDEAVRMAEEMTQDHELTR